jgi:Conserved oligomeric complex COG6
MQTLSTRTETPEFLSSLSTLSEFYGQNTASERRNLRSTIEQQGLAVDTEFLAAASTVIASLDAIEADVVQLSACCRSVGSSLASSKVSTCYSVHFSTIDCLPWPMDHGNLLPCQHRLQR